MQRVLETLSLFLLIGVTVVRPLVSESYDSAASPFTAALPGLQDPSPLRTLYFDLAILVAALGLLLARAVGQSRPYRRTGLELGAAIVLVAAVVSCLFAGNKRLAINATVDWLCYPVLAITLTQLLHRSQLRRILLAGVLASACVQVFYCAEQSWFGFDETWEHYQTIKTQFWTDQGVDLNSGRVEAFEQRMLAHEATGVLPHSNVTASYLVLCGFAAIGVASACWRRQAPRHEFDSVARSGVPDGREPIVPRWIVNLTLALIAASLLGGVLLTKSVGAIVSAEIGLALWMIVWGFRTWFGRNRGRALLIAWAMTGIGAGAVVGHGLWHDSLPGVSLTFRWQYWQSSAAMVSDHPLTGVGRENFGRHYLQYKPIESPEEVANPHNLLVQAATDWGILGLAGMVAMLLGASIAVTRVSTEESVRAGPASSTSSPSSWCLWGIGLLLFVVCGLSTMLGTEDPRFVYYKTVTTGLVWSFSFIAVALALHHATLGNPPRMESLRTGVAIGLFTFLLHDAINFALFVPGTATTLFALLAFCTAERWSEHDDQAIAPASRRWLPPMVAAAVALLAVLYGIMPVAGARAKIALAQSKARAYRDGPLEQQPVYRLLADAIDADRWDPTPCARQAEWLMAVSSLSNRQQEAWKLAKVAINQAITRDPVHLKPRRVLVNLHLTRAAALGEGADYLAAVAAAHESMKLYPLDPKGQVRLADCQLQAGRALGSEELLRAAVERYREAIALDDRRLAWERLRRFRDRERSEIQGKMKKALAALRALEP